MMLALHGRGRPLRFLALVVIGWVALRIAILWPQTGSLPAAMREILSFEPRIDEPALPPAAAAPQPPQPAPVMASHALALHTISLHASAPQYVTDPGRVRLATLGLIQFGPAEYTDTPPVFTAPAQTHFEPAPSRWSASAWVTLRPGSGFSTAPGGQLGGSQGGVRIAWMVDPDRRIALFGRVVSPLSGAGREAAVGVEWQPSRAPVRIVAEQRFTLDGGRGGTGLGLVAGIDKRIPGGFRLESYGQAGAIRRDRLEPYADGSARATRRVPGTPVSLGAGAWGAVQRDASRVDIGPSATLDLPVAGQRFRLALDWRQRVSGDARPGSGIALTLGGDF